MKLDKLREPISGITHIAGAILSVIGLIVLMQYALLYRSNGAISFLIFGISLILLYTASGVYHSIIMDDKVIMVLRKLDHAMIYVLIAGTYTPICVVGIKGKLGIGLLIAIWSLAVAGIIMKMFWMSCPRWLNTSFYLIMGWLSVIIVSPLAKIVPLSAVVWLAAGGIMYTVGAVIYAIKKPKLNLKYFGFHEIFHVFVMLGSVCHYWLMIRYILFIV